jgi:ankyrin repeat protein
MPLWSAAEAGRSLCVQHLVEHAPSCFYLNWPDSNGDTPLHAACAGNHCAAAAAICAGIAAGATVADAAAAATSSADAVLHAVNAKGYTPAHVSTGKADVTCTLVVCCNVSYCRCEFTLMRLLYGILA